jgi:O-antigen ligase
MLALLGGYLNIWQLLAIVVLIVLIIVWMQVRKRG